GCDARQGGAGKDTAAYHQRPYPAHGSCRLRQSRLRSRADDPHGQARPDSYYACSAKINGSASRCSCKAIREEQLDDVVLEALKQRILEPARLRELLAHVIEASDEVNERRARDLQQARAERTRAERAIGKLLE